MDVYFLVRQVKKSKFLVINMKKCIITAKSQILFDDLIWT